MRFLALPLIVLALLGTGAQPASAHPATQAPEAQAILQASAQAMAGVQTMRYTATYAMTQPAGMPSNQAIARCLAETGDVATCTAPQAIDDASSPVLADPLAQPVSITGAFQAPDRQYAHFVHGPPALGRELITIGQSWTRPAGAEWRPGLPGYGPLNPATLATALEELRADIQEPVLTQEPGRIVLTGRFPVAAAGGQDLALVDLLGAGFFGGVSAELHDAQVRLVFAATSQHLLELAAELPLTLTPLPPPAGFEAPVVLAPFTQRLVASITLADFDDPTIRIESPH